MTASSARWAAWNTREIVVTAALGVALGLASAPINASYDLLVIALGPLLAQALTGCTIFVALFIPYVIQRPGAALIGQLLVGLVQLPFSPSGLLSLVINIIYGVLCEVPFALTRYKLYSLPLLCGIGALVGGIGLALGYAPNAFHLLAPAMQVGLWALVLGVCVGGGWLAKALADSLVKTGVLSGTALASRVAEER